MATFRREAKWASRVAVVPSEPIILFILFFESPHRGNDLLHQAAVVFDLPFFLVAGELTEIAGQWHILFNIAFFLIEIVWVFSIVLALRLIYVFLAGRQVSSRPSMDR